MPSIVHCKKRPDAYYIGRKYTGHHFGNPFSHLKNSMAEIIVETREEAISRFKTWLLGQSDLDLLQDRRKWILDHLHLLKDKDLGCYCSPLPCHGDIYLELLYK